MTNLSQIVWVFITIDFLDLRTRKCSEYLTFSDTAIAIKKYILPDSSSLINGLALFSTEVIPHTKPVEFLKDTNIESITYKRMKILDSRDNFPWISYFRCEKKGSIFSYYGGLKDNEGCPMTRYEIQYDIIAELDYVSSALSAEELKVMNTWALKNN